MVEEEEEEEEEKERSGTVVTGIVGVVEVLVEIGVAVVCCVGYRGCAEV